MQPSSHAVCVNMQPYDDGYGKNAEPPGPLQARGPAGPPPKDFVLWSLFNFAFLNCCCLGFAALAFSIKARDRKVLGDQSGAGSYGSTAKCLNIMALLLSLLSIIVLIILAATGAIALSYRL